MKNLLHGPSVRALIGYAVLASLFFLFLLLQPSTVGVSYDWNITQSLKSFSHNPITSAWIEGAPRIPGNGYFFDIMTAVAYRLGLSVAVFTTILLIVVVTLAGWFCFLLLRRWSISSWASFFGGIVYLTAPQLFLLLHHGYLYALIAYCSVPLLILLFLRYFEDKKLTTALAGAFLFSISATQMQYYLVTAVILAVVAIVLRPQRRYLIRLILLYLAVALLIASPWLLLYLSLRFEFGTFLAQVQSSGFVGFQSNSVMDLLYLPFTNSSVREHLRSIGMGWFVFFWQVCSMAVFAAPLILRAFVRRTNTAAASISAAGLSLLVIGILLTKGRHEPFSWLGDAFFGVPLLGALFRDINHWQYLITMSGVFLAAWACSTALSWATTRIRRMAVLGASGAFCLVLAFPSIAGLYAQFLHPYSLDQATYGDLVKHLRKTAVDIVHSVLWLPSGLYVRYNDGLATTGVNPLPGMIPQQEALDVPTAQGATAPSLLRQLIAFGSCDRILGCPERLLGLLNIRTILHAQQDFSSAVPLIEKKSYYRNARFWSSETVREWFKTRTHIAARTEGRVATVTLADEILIPRVFLPKRLLYVQGPVENILDGVALSLEPTTSFIRGSTFPDAADSVLLPLHFTEESETKIQHNTFQLLTTLRVPEEGDYQVVFYARQGGSSAPLTLLEVTAIDHDRREIQLRKVEKSSQELRGKNPVYSGFSGLRKGEYRLVISNVVNATNLLLDPLFTNGPWSGRTYNCFFGAGASSVSRSENGKTYLHVESGAEDACQQVVIGNLRRDQQYLFSLDVQHQKGTPLEVCARFEEDDYCHGVQRVKETTTEWQHVEFMMRNVNSSRAILELRVRGNIPSATNLTNADFRMVDMPETMAFFRADRGGESYRVDDMEYRKIDATKYRVILRQAQGRVPLVLTERFHSSWRATVIGQAAHLPSYRGTAHVTRPRHGVVENNNLPAGSLWETFRKPILSRHESVNGAANLWFFDAGKTPVDVEIVLEFAPQRWYTLGRWIAAGTVLAIVIFLLLAGVWRWWLARTTEPEKRNLTQR